MNLHCLNVWYSSLNDVDTLEFYLNPAFKFISQFDYQSLNAYHDITNRLWLSVFVGKVVANFDAVDIELSLMCQTDDILCVYRKGPAAEGVPLLHFGVSLCLLYVAVIGSIYLVHSFRTAWRVVSGFLTSIISDNSLCSIIQGLNKRGKTNVSIVDSNP